MLTRRSLILSSLAVPGLGASELGAYAVGVEPLLITEVTRYHLRPPSWPADLRLTIAAVADVHACEPWMSVGRIEQIVQITNALGADVIALLGDYVAGHTKIAAIVSNRDWARALARCGRRSASTPFWAIMIGGPTPPHKRADAGRSQRGSPLKGRAFRCSKTSVWPLQEWRSVLVGRAGRSIGYSRSVLRRI